MVHVDFTYEWQGGTQAPEGSPYRICRRDTGEVLVEVYEFGFGTIFVDLFMMVRDFPVILTFPQLPPPGSNYLPGYMWTTKPLSRKEMRDAGWQLVAVDLVNGVECHAYRAHATHIDVKFMRDHYVPLFRHKKN